ncbi:MAG: TIGR04282 family arsenosugar biosynthesis glycosyltransferase [Caldimonas sp.]
MSDRCAIVVFAKAPVAGYAKTRLVPALGAEGAARLARLLLTAAVEQALQADVGPVELCCSPDATHEAFAALAAGRRVTLTLQGEGDLGLRMGRAFDRVLATEPRALLIGTDAPGLDAAYLRGAARALVGCDAVLGPAHDGGYTLIGLRKAAAGLFHGVSWSTPHVLAQTRARLASLGLRSIELEPLADIDEPDDLRHLPADWRLPLFER